MKLLLLLLPFGLAHAPHVFETCSCWRPSNNCFTAAHWWGRQPMNFGPLYVSNTYAHAPSPPFVLIDPSLKRPAVTSEQFTSGENLPGTFPIYKEDAAAVAAAAEKIARMLAEEAGCYQVDTMRANRTQFVISYHCQPYKSVSVRLLTRISEQNLVCVFLLIRQEEKYRRAQRRLLDFSSYVFP